ncbi:MAG: leucine-rich repeat domain-containing protein, partial [Alphaproteobacteria bacterium]
MTSDDKIHHLDRDQARALLSQAQEQKWETLILLGPDAYIPSDPHFWPDHFKSGTPVYSIEDTDLAAVFPGVLELESLRSLDLHGNDIGEEGAKAI